MTIVFSKQENCRMWNITALDYETALFGNAEAREIVGVSPMLWAKWVQRTIAAPTRPGRGRGGGLYSAKRIFEMRLIRVIAEHAAIPVSEAQEIAALATKGPWNTKELSGRVKNWRFYVLRDSPPPVDVQLLFSKTDGCWEYKILGTDRIENAAAVIVAAARELIAVSKACWTLSNAPAAIGASRET
jgi:hypothetical protein